MWKICGEVNQVIKLKNSDVKESDIRKLNNSEGENRNGKSI